MNNLTPETRLKRYQEQSNPDGIKAMLELIDSKEHQKTMREFVK